MVRLGLLGVVGVVIVGDRVLYVVVLILVGDFNMVERLVNGVEGRLDGRVKGNGEDGKRNLPDLLVGM